jgi:hypothetical protein
MESVFAIQDIYHQINAFKIAPQDFLISTQLADNVIMDVPLVQLLLLFVPLA